MSMNAAMSVRSVSAEKTGRVVGVLMTLAIHAVILTLVSFNGLKYIYPPPQEEPIVLDFMELDSDPVPVKTKSPASKTVDKSKPVETVQKSQSPVQQNIANETPAAPADNFGDVEAPARQEPRLDPRASFPGMSRKQSDATTPHSADEATDRLREGAPDGNMAKSSVDGRPNAHLQGRKVEGTLIKPNYSSQKSGVVVVKIMVDIYGNVKEAYAGVSGTTLDDKTLWAEARNAAMKTHFTPLAKVDENTPQRQEGTITYIFNLK